MPTIKDVAEKAGVSITTVSRVMNKRGYISQKTYQAVYDAMEELNYHRNELARSLFAQKTYYIGLLIPDVSHPFFSELTRQIEILLYERGYKLILCNTEGKQNREHDYLIMLQQNKVDGMIIGTHMLAIDEYKKIDLPIVAIDITLGEYIPSVSVDHKKGGIMAAERFIKNNSHCVLQIRGNSDVKSPVWTRHSIFKKKLENAGIRCIDYELKTDEFNVPNYYSIMNRLFDMYPEIDGIFSTDSICAFAIKCARERDKRIPEDIRILGYDGTIISKILSPSLTCVIQPFNLIAYSIVDTLIRKINGEILTSDIILPVSFIEGESA